MLRKEVQLWQKEILAMNSDSRQGLFTRAMMLTAKQEQSKDLSQWQTAMNSHMIRATSTGAVQAQKPLHTQRRFKSAVSSGKACVPWGRRGLRCSCKRCCGSVGTFLCIAQKRWPCCIFKRNIYCGLQTSERTSQRQIRCWNNNCWHNRHWRS